MFVDFDKISNDSSLLVFCSDKEIVDDNLTKDLISFIKSWTSHGEDVFGSCKVFFNQLVIVAFDESDNIISGCSKDKCYNLFKDFKLNYNLDFFRRDLVFYIDNNIVKVKELEVFKKIPLVLRSSFVIINIFIKTKNDISLNFKQNYCDSVWAKICL